jgi:hypothetical protein
MCYHRRVTLLSNPLLVVTHWKLIERFQRAGVLDSALLDRTRKLVAAELARAGRPYRRSHRYRASPDNRTYDVGFSCA